MRGARGVGDTNRATFVRTLETLIVPDFTPKKNVRIQVNENENVQDNTGTRLATWLGMGQGARTNWWPAMDVERPQTPTSSPSWHGRCPSRTTSPGTA